ncbi:MAG: hypothetical protein GY771_01320 [bacterium]|nr:hypothetical protein [bacterium]
MAVLKALVIALSISTVAASAEDVIVFTASQSWNSRIYVLNMNGQVLDYWEYEYYIFSDMEVANDEVYVTDWVAPRLYKVNIENGSLETIVDDWGLFSMYDVAWDGSYFYIDEWSLNRYDINGSWDSAASFDLATRGSAYDGQYYWTLNADGHIQCWDISVWPAITEVPGNNFDPPTPDCKGLWFNGMYFWSAEAIDGALGEIYKFDYDGNVIEQWTAPAYTGFAAVVADRPATGVKSASLGEIKGMFR